MEPWVQTPEPTVKSQHTGKLLKLRWAAPHLRPLGRPWLKQVDHKIKTETEQEHTEVRWGLGGKEWWGWEGCKTQWSGQVWQEWSIYIMLLSKINYFLTVWARWWILVIPALGRCRKVDPRVCSTASLAMVSSHPMRDNVSKNKGN